MLLVQKQPNFNLNRIQSTLHNQHRRHPSAPAPSLVVVQPTQTPGLLSLSKPQQQQRHQPQQRSARTPPAAKSSPTVATTATNGSPTSPSLPRGRQTKDKTAAAPRSDSAAARQPAQRQSSPSQAEVPSVTNDASDPFLVSAPVSTPAISTRPSGKLARRRQQHQQQPSVPNTPTNSKVSAHIDRAQPVVIPAPSFNNSTKPLSRSAPVPKAVRHRKAESLLPAWDFPICDDMTEVSDAFKSSAPLAPSFSEPVTPPRRRSPKPATSPSSGRKQRPRNHKRAPSDSGMVFNMSSDESGSENSRDEDLMALLNGMKMARQAAPLTPGQAAGFFASSMFQNSPSPDELPAPIFL